MIGNMTIDRAGNWILDKAVNRINEYKEKKQWEKLFVDTHEFLLKNVEQGDQILFEIADCLSSAELRKVAQRLTLESKFDLIDRLQTELVRIMMRYEIPKNEAEYYVSGFISVILQELERNNQETAQCAYLGDWRKKEDATLEEVKKQLSVISGAISKMNKQEVMVYTPEQIEVSLYKETIEPKLSLDFFEIDDEVFKEEFEESLAKENIYIKGQSKEETIYCVLNEIRRIKPDKLVLIVKSESDWKKLRSANEEEPELGGKVLIPWFYAEQILSIPHNTNIFVFGSEEQPVGKSILELRKRKGGTVRACLCKLGMDEEKAYKLVEDTHGLYIPMKKKMINGIDLKSPNWLKGDMKVLIPLLLCGKWTETEGDIMVLEDLCGMKYKDIQEIVREYTNGEDPLFVSFNAYGRKVFHLASTENAWGYLDSYVDIDGDLWKKYVDLICCIVAEEDPAYSFPKHQQHYAHLLPGGTPCWSTVLKEGLLRSLVMKAYFNNNLQNQEAVDDVITRILDNIKNKNQWLSIAKLFPVLSESSPSAIINRLDVEWSKETGLKEVFIETSDEGHFAKNEYTGFLWGVEQLLGYKEYAGWAVRWLFRMSELRKEYPISNSPYESLKQIFCPWYNVTVLTQNEKILLAKEAFVNKYDVWDLFYSELPGMNISMVNIISRPKYRMVPDSLELTYGEVWNAYDEYTKLCINNMDYMVSRWEKIISHINHFKKEEVIRQVIDKLLFEVESMNDAEKASIKEKIREEIYRNRLYNTSEWAMQEKGIDILVETLGQIHVDNPIYDYRYLFKYQYDFPLMNPHPFAEDERRDHNKKLEEKEIQQGIDRFIAEGFDPIELAGICAECKNTTLGSYLFLYYSKEQFDVDLYCQMIGDEKINNIMLDYVYSACRYSKENLQIAYRIAKGKKIQSDVIAHMLLAENINDSESPLIMEADEEVKKIYWGSYRRGYSITNKKVALMAINEMLKYSDQLCLLEMLYSCEECLTEEEILGTLEKSIELEVGDEISSSRFHAEKLFARLQDAFIDTDNCIRVALMEIHYNGLISVAKMRCYTKCLADSPVILLHMISLLFRTDDGNIVDGVEIDESKIHSIFSIYYDLKFCPANENGKVNSEKLNKWILDFEDGLKKNKQLRMFDSVLGKLLACSPVGEDGISPAEEIRSFIEERQSKELVEAFATAIFNSRGVYTSTGGEAERKLAQGYKENADKLRVAYPTTSGIYDRLYRMYIHEADSERECDEYAGV